MLQRVTQSTQITQQQKQCREGFTSDGTARGILTDARWLGFLEGGRAYLEPLGLGAGLEEPEKSGGRTACNPTPRSETSSGTGIVGTGSACLLCAKLGRVKPGDGRGGA